MELNVEMKVSSIQLESADVKNKQVMLAHALDMMDKCKGSDLIVLPELWNVGFFNYDNYKNSAESIDGETVSALSNVVIFLPGIDSIVGHFS